MSDMHECITGTDGLYNPLLFGIVNASAVDLELGVWLGPPLDSGDGFGACSECVCECWFQFYQ